MSGNFDVVVAGAGPAGIAAAVRAAEAGARVALVDDNPAAGGQIWRSGAKQPTEAQRWLARLESAAVERYQGARIFDAGAGVVRAERQAGDAAVPGNCAEIGYRNLIMATGARERFLPFPGWTLPNVLGAGGLDAMVRGGLPVAGKRVVVAGTGPLLLAVAGHLAARGAEVVAVCEQASLRRVAGFGFKALRQPGKLGQGAELLLAARGAKFWTECWPLSARGAGKLEAVILRRRGEVVEVACDYLACGFHLVPNLELPLLLGCRLEHGFVAVDEAQRTSVEGVYCAGEPTGIGGVERALVEGQIAGLAAVGQMSDALLRERARSDGFVAAMARSFELNAELRSLPAEETFVCRCEDVTYGALRRRRSWRDAKLQTRCGMGACQGRICGAATEFLFGWRAESVRPPIVPVAVANLRGAEATHSADQTEEARKDQR